YKSLTSPKKCVDCQLKKVKKAYHVLCDDCASKKGVCAKCQDSGEIIEEFNTKSIKEIEKEQQDMERRLASMRVRDRRSYLRKLERGDINPSDVPDLGDENSDFEFTDSEDEGSQDDE
ncbi:hypothetical protein GGF43_002353, partial [Coemansia sp. RSA 2618]